MNREGVILIIDDDRDVLFTARTILKPEFKEVLTLDNPEGIESLLCEHNVDAVVLDMNFSPGQVSGKEGITWLRKILGRFPGTHIIMSTAYGDIDLAVESMKLGAIDFLIKPWEKEKLVSTIATVVKLKKAGQRLELLEQKNRAMHRDIDRNLGQIVTRSIRMERVMETVRKVAPTDASVLVIGENGTGKELVARAIHRLSSRSTKDFISVDLGSLPDSLFEAEMFGHLKGAFTGAYEERAGRFEIASGGTLFLDEIGNLSISSQGKLLSAVQNRKITRLGSSREVELDIRLICATNKTPHELRDRNRFREDLLYRINTIEINVPPLRERVEDIQLLSDYFLEIYSQRYGKRISSGLNREALTKLKNYSWPGNIRELQHTMERAVILCEGGSVKASDLMISGKAGEHSTGKGHRIKDIEAEAIRKALIECNGNLSAAAETLGFGRSTLYRKIKLYGL